MKNAVYLAIFLSFVRKVFKKVHIDIPGGLPVYSVDGSECYNVCIYSAPIAYSYDRAKARLLAAAIAENFPMYRKALSMVEDEELDTYTPGMIPQVKYEDHLKIRELIEEFDCGY